MKTQFLSRNLGVANKWEIGVGGPPNIPAKRPVNRHTASRHEIRGLNRFPEQAGALPASSIAMQQDVALGSRKEFDLRSVRLEDCLEELDVPSFPLLGFIDSKWRAVLTGKSIRVPPIVFSHK